MTCPRFVADVMVGRLARWLRILGYDVAYSNHYEDDEILRLAEAESRIVLTRDKGLLKRAAGATCLLIESDDYEEQVGQVLGAYDLRTFSLFSRCAECNHPLEDVDKESVFERIPPYVYLTYDRFRACLACGRVYWHGTHAEKIRRKVNRWLKCPPSS